MTISGDLDPSCTNNCFSFPQKQEGYPASQPSAGYGAPAPPAPGDSYGAPAPVPSGQYGAPGGGGHF